MQAPAALSAKSGDGTSQKLVEAGASLPSTTRSVFATSRAGQDRIDLELHEDPGLLIGRLSFPLPRGLPANCWIPVFVTVGADLCVRAEARENLRRLRVDGEADATDAAAQHYSLHGS